MCSLGHVVCSLWTEVWSVEGVWLLQHRVGLRTRQCARDGVVRREWQASGAD